MNKTRADSIHSPCPIHEVVSDGSKTSHRVPLLAVLGAVVLWFFCHHKEHYCALRASSGTQIRIDKRAVRHRLGTSAPNSPMALPVEGDVIFCRIADEPVFLDASE